MWDDMSTQGMASGQAWWAHVTLEWGHMQDGHKTVPNFLRVNALAHQFKNGKNRQQCVDVTGTTVESNKKNE